LRLAVPCCTELFPTRRVAPAHIREKAATVPFRLPFFLLPQRFDYFAAQVDFRNEGAGRSAACPRNEKDAAAAFAGSETNFKSMRYHYRIGVI
jgi:hypothetical protein